MEMALDAEQLQKGKGVDLLLVELMSHPSAHGVYSEETSGVRRILLSQGVLGNTEFR